MLKPGCTLVAFDLNDTIDRFCELSGWESTEQGEWNARYDKPVTFKIEYGDGDNFFQNGQDYLCIDPYDNDDVINNLEDIRKIYPTHTYKHIELGLKTLHKIPIGCIVSYLRAQGELPKDIPIILTNCYWCH